MGKARNHGGTGGHGYFPLPGERPNYNHHVVADKELLNLVTNKDGNKVAGTSERKPMATGNQLKEQRLSVKQSVTSDKKKSAKKLVTPVNQPVAPLMQMDTPVKHHVTSSFHQVNPVKHLLTPAKEQTTHLNQKVTSVNQQETPYKQLITPEDPDKLLVTAIKQPVTKLRIQRNV